MRIKSTFAFFRFLTLLLPAIVLRDFLNKGCTRIAVDSHSPFFSVGVHGQHLTRQFCLVFLEFVAMARNLLRFDTPLFAFFAIRTIGACSPCFACFLHGGEPFGNPVSCKRRDICIGYLRPRFTHNT